MTDFRMLRRALIAGITVPALALTACSMEEISDAVSTDTANGADAGSGDDGEGGSSDGDSSGSDLLDFDDDDSVSIEDIDLTGAPEDFDPTQLGRELSLGQSAYVVTQRPAEDSGDGDNSAAASPKQYWKVTAQELTDLDSDHIEVGADAGEVEKFVCITYELEFLGLDDSSESAGTADQEDQDVQPPELRAVDEDGNPANVVEGAVPEDCDIDQSDLLPEAIDDLEEDVVYQGAVLSYQTNDGAGVTPTGLEFQFDVDLDEDEAENADGIYWY